MKVAKVGVGLLVVACVCGCERIERVVSQGNKVRAAEAEEMRRLAVEDEAIAKKKKADELNAEREAFRVFVKGKETVARARADEAAAALKALETDRTAFSKELQEKVGAEGQTGGVWLEQALQSPKLNELAMKYLHTDFSLKRGEFAEAIRAARQNEAEFASAMRQLGQTFEGQLVQNPKKEPEDMRKKNLAALEKERQMLENKRRRLVQSPPPAATTYKNQQDAYRRNISQIDTRLREVIRNIDQLRANGNERVRAVTNAKSTREGALRERIKAEDKLKQEYAKKETVLKVVEAYNAETLRKLERALVQEAAALEGDIKRAREAAEFLKGIQDGVPSLSREGLKTMREQVEKL